MRDLTLSEDIEMLLFIPELPFNKANLQFRRLINSLLIESAEEKRHLIQCVYISPLFGVVLEDLENVYPLIQNEYPMSLSETIPKRSLRIIEEFLVKYRDKIPHLIINNSTGFRHFLLKLFYRICRRT